MSDARRYALWPEPRSRSLKGSRPSVPHGTNFFHEESIPYDHAKCKSAISYETLMQTLVCDSFELVFVNAEIAD